MSKMMESKFIFDKRNDIVRRVLATQEIWKIRENLTIPRETVEPPASPIDIEANIKYWDESRIWNCKSPTPPVSPIEIGENMNIWNAPQQLNRKTPERPVSPMDIGANIKLWNAPHQLNRKTPDFHKRIRFKHNDKENIGTKSDRRRSHYKSIECGFCKNNGESQLTYNGHRLKDEHGRVICPRLRAVVCPICLDTGENAHTIKYCPNDKKIVFQDGFRV